MTEHVTQYIKLKKLFIFSQKLRIKEKKIQEKEFSTQIEIQKEN